ncbi:hypothetical protein [Thiohalocapsa sp. ML1]|jgi:hypothetical protein|uniref:hypothetical protein n=1 Tax=Thiohalocapsa sp. ML1 TaxID=1431688 RepID=UPI0007320E28|nr:hypothetical protein [Thiohalocapsa sp. ML1]
MSAIREHQVSTMAHRIGLRLVQPADERDLSLYRLVEPSSMQPVYPGGGELGVGLDELEDWLRFPWE